MPGATQARATAAFIRKLKKAARQIGPIDRTDATDIPTALDKADAADYGRAVASVRSRIQKRAAALTEHLAVEGLVLPKFFGALDPANERAHLPTRLVLLFEPVPASDLARICRRFAVAAVTPFESLPIGPFGGLWAADAVRDFQRAVHVLMDESERPLTRDLKSLEKVIERLLSTALQPASSKRKADKAELTDLAIGLFYAVAERSIDGTIDGNHDKLIDLAMRCGEFFGTESRRGLHTTAATEMKFATRVDTYKKRRQRRRHTAKR
ncbi:MAG: hypothetical protein IPK60_09390 [Sandaracinaceae bacterium]|nr:hypothetical protein [Sandaracinaceae bacterium]